MATLGHEKKANVSVNNLAFDDAYFSENDILFQEINQHFTLDSIYLRVNQACVICMRLRSKIENSLTGYVLQVQKGPILLRFTHYI